MQDKVYKSLILPKLSWQATSSATYGELVVEPLEAGYGVTCFVVLCCHLLKVQQ